MLHHAAAKRLERRERRAALNAMTAANAGGKTATELFDALRD